MTTVITITNINEQLTINNEQLALSRGTKALTYIAIAIAFNVGVGDFKVKAIAFNVGVGDFKVKAIAFNVGVGDFKVK
ncbi:MAG: hypothetical protein F6K35_39050, partial [Okeania sp. SIO2H7]|nr:hypothetical protein [Okeania sp. SIO2H7]